MSGYIIIEVKETIKSIIFRVTEWRGSRSKGLRTIYEKIFNMCEDKAVIQTRFDRLSSHSRDNNKYSSCF